MNLDYITITLLLFFIFFDKKIQIRKKLFIGIIKLRFMFVSSSNIGLSWYYVIILMLMNFSLLYFSIIIKILLFYYFYYIYKFLLFNIYLSYNYTFKSKKLLIFIIFILFVIFNFFVKIIFFIIFIDLFVCVSSRNDQYDLLFMGFTEEFFEVNITYLGALKVCDYYELLIYDNLYSFEELRDNTTYIDNLDYVYKNYNDYYS